MEVTVKYVTIQWTDDDSTLECKVAIGGQYDETVDESFDDSIFYWFDTEPDFNYAYSRSQTEERYEDEWFIKRIHGTDTYDATTGRCISDDEQYRNHLLMSGI